MNSRCTARFLYSCLLILLMVSPPLLAQPLYKWVDDDGIIRYGDVLPSDRIGKAYQLIAPDGRVLKTQQAAKSPEEIRQLRAERRRREREERIQAEVAARMAAIQEHHDNVLLMTFTSEEEIKIAKDERLDVINSVIELLSKNIQTEKAKLEREEKLAKKLYTDKGLEIPGGQAQKIEYFSEKVLSKQQHLSQKLEEREKIKQQYQRDLVRYRELTEQRRRQQEALEKARREAEEKALYE